MLNGKLIVIEGSDGSGKATQTKKLFERLISENHAVKKISFPNYNSNSSALIKMYLNGDFGTHADDVDPYAASTFYAVDRYASYRTEWKKFFEDDEIILADRYTTSNMIHQAVKIADNFEREKFLEWLDDFEFVKLKLPRPDLVIFLNMPPNVSEKLIKERNRNDIHEKDFDYLRRCYSAYNELTKKFGWIKINCSDNDSPRSIEEIHENIFNVVRKIL
ncbi:MAG: thymidylate kinase [Selenomonadaceae bacterium]|nr:thymidylate kinase [Selenomonadaceae bacterium]